MPGFPSSSFKAPKMPSAPKAPKAPKMPKAPSVPGAPGSTGGASSDSASGSSDVSTPLTSEPTAAVGAARWLNILGIFAVITIITITLMQQFGYGLAPSYLGTVQRSALIGVAIGPILNLLWGMSPQHYAVSLFSAMIGGLSSGLQMLRGAQGTLTLDPNDIIVGLPIYEWALVVFVGAMISIGCMLLWIKSWAAWDHGITNHRSPSRAIAYMTMIWLAMYLVLIIIQTLFACGAGGCPTNPSSTGSQSVMFTFSINGSGGNSASISIPGFISVLIFMGLVALIAGLIINHRQRGPEADDAR